MKRREALCRLAILSGGVLLSTSSWISAVAGTNKVRTKLSVADIPLLNEIGETILPATKDAPGAKAANVGAYMVAMVNDCFTQTRQNTFLQGLNTLENTCQRQYKKAFLQLTKDQKKAFLKHLDTESKVLSKDKAGAAPTEHYFSMLKQLTINGYFSSEVGATKGLRYVAIPGRFEGCVHIKPGDKPWASV